MKRFYFNCRTSRKIVYKVPENNSMLGALKYVHQLSLQVTNECCVSEVDTEPTAAKLRKTGDPPGREDLRLPDGLPAQHVGDLLAYLDKSICKEALLGNCSMFQIIIYLNMLNIFTTFSNVFVCGSTTNRFCNCPIPIIIDYF